MATLTSVTRHSAGDLTLYFFNFASIGTVDAYAVTNMAGAVGAWANPWVGTTTKNSFGVNYTNSDTGVTLSFIASVATTTATVFVLGVG